MAKDNADSDYGYCLEEIFSSLSMEDEISPVEECKDDIGICQTCSKRPALPNNPKRLKKSSCKCKKQLAFNIESELPENSPEYSTSENDEDNEKLAEPLGLEELNIASLPEGHSIATTSSENEITPEIGASKRKHSADGENWVICKKKLKCDCKKQFNQKRIKQELVHDSNCNLNSLDSQSGPQPLTTDTSTGEHKPEDVEGILKLKNVCDESEDTRIRKSRTEVAKCLGSMKHIKKEMLQLFDLESNSASLSKFNKTTELECDDDLLNLLPDCGDAIGNKKCHHHNKDSLAVPKEQSMKTKYSGFELQMIQEEDELKSVVSSQVETVKRRVPSFPIINNYFKHEKERKPKGEPEEQEILLQPT
ncbi:Protein of unknown function [Gryllus bimaculatus]|nr:Protein of unknown function [Gryllus bimaculatus]